MSDLIFAATVCLDTKKFEACMHWIEDIHACSLACAYNSATHHASCQESSVYALHALWWGRCLSYMCMCVCVFMHVFACVYACMIQESTFAITLYAFIHIHTPTHTYTPIQTQSHMLRTSKHAHRARKCACRRLRLATTPCANLPAKNKGPCWGSGSGTRICARSSNVAP